MEPARRPAGFVYVLRPIDPHDPDDGPIIVAMFWFAVCALIVAVVTGVRLYDALH